MGEQCSKICTNSTNNIGIQENEVVLNITYVLKI